jgi:hypothetical protein
MADNRNLLPLTPEEKQDLERWAQSRTLPAGDVFRARLILALAEGQSYRQILFCVDEKTAIQARHWIASIRCCRSRRVAPNGMASSITVMGPYRSMRPSM